MEYVSNILLLNYPTERMFCNIKNYPERYGVLCYHYKFLTLLDRFGAYLLAERAANLCLIYTVANDSFY